MRKLIAILLLCVGCYDSPNRYAVRKDAGPDLTPVVRGYVDGVDGFWLYDSPATEIYLKGPAFTNVVVEARTSNGAPWYQMFTVVNPRGGCWTMWSVPRAAQWRIRTEGYVNGMVEVEFGGSEYHELCR